MKTLGLFIIFTESPFNLCPFKSLAALQVKLISAAPLPSSQCCGLSWVGGVGGVAAVSASLKLQGY